MAKNKYPDSLGLADCKNFYDLFEKLRNFYGTKSVNYKDVIIEILLQQHTIDRSENNSLQMHELFKCIAKDYVPDTYKASGGHIREYERNIDIRSSKNSRQGYIIAMFDLVMARGVSQNRAAQIIENKGMSKGIKRRYHEAKKNESAVNRAGIIIIPSILLEVFGRQENIMICQLGSLIKDYKELKLNHE
jgi:hypothetical protein